MWRFVESLENIWKYPSNIDTRIRISIKIFLNLAIRINREAELCSLLITFYLFLLTFYSLCSSLFNYCFLYFFFLTFHVTFLPLIFVSGTNISKKLFIFQHSNTFVQILSSFRYEKILGTFMRCWVNRKQKLNFWECLRKSNLISSSRPEALVFSWFLYL